MDLTYNEDNYQIMSQFGDPHEGFSLYTNYPVLLWYGENFTSTSFVLEPVKTQIVGHHGVGNKALKIQISNDEILYSKEVLANLSIGLGVRAIDSNDLNTIILRTDTAPSFATGENLLIESLYICLIDAGDESILFLGTNDLIPSDI